MTVRFLLARHGQTEWNAQKRFMGQLDIPLDETGRAQVAALGTRLKDEHMDMIYASDLSRAWDTALAIQARLASHASIKPESRLREMNFGDWQGLTYAEIQERDPQNLAHWEEDRLHHAPPNGETLLAFSERVVSAYREWCAAHAEQKILLVGHGGSLQLLLAHALGLSPDKFWQLHLSNASLTDLRVYESGAILNLLNDTCHLPTSPLPMREG
ncbi:MAG: alpha-ribazole phosphatase [Anaerolineales bacterium]|nr:alpha-ribazole phosphatase [Anaerolineales bacterium]